MTVSSLHRALILVFLSSTPAVAQDPDSAAADTSPSQAEPQAEVTGAAQGPSVDERLEQLEAANEELRAQIRSAQRKKVETSHLTLGEVSLRLMGYLDAGFFKASGDGVAYALDAGKRLHPEFKDVPWVFVGDPWANPVNSQGDSADLGLDRTNITRWDPIRSGGRPTFLLNMVNVGLVASLGQEFLFETSLNFEPRNGLLGAAGDFIDLDLAYLEWVPFESVDVHFFVGKFEPTFGLEYRQRKASDRYNITPSLIARYTVGPQVGVKARGSFFEQALNWNVAVTNGSSSTERFAHFTNEVDANAGKTLSGRVGYQLPIGAFLEVGVSGAYGPQDLQPSDKQVHWQLGADAKLMVGDLTLRGEYLRSVAEGGGLAEAPMLDAEGFYVDGSYQILPWIGAYARVDYRKALLLADTNMYVSNVGRVTGGVRFDINFHVALKVEYLHLATFGGDPDLDDDVFTSSAVFKF